jgi:serine/threonine protein kinase
MAIDAVPDRIGPYELHEVLGEGGMGTVYRAVQTEPVQREVALKIIKAGMDTEEVVTRFRSERQALAVMDHTSIAKVRSLLRAGAGRGRLHRAFLRRR